jgi:HEPN domain-containing protein
LQHLSAEVITAKALLKAERLLHTGFFCHAVVEKALKAVISDKTGEIPPKIHDLPKLANLAGLWVNLENKYKELFKKLTPLQIETRYPEYKDKVAKTLTVKYCEKLISETEGFLCWIKQLLWK